MQNQVEQLYDSLLGYVKSRISHREDAEDITQEVFYKLSKADTEGVENLKSWVYAIAKNAIVDHYRKVKADHVSVENHLVVEDEEENVTQELSSCIKSFVNMLPDDYRMVMTLSELDNIPQKEVAQRLNMNYVTVRSKIQRGRIKLKRLFSDCCTIEQGGKGSIMGFSSRKDTRDAGCSDSC